MKLAPMLIASGLALAFLGTNPLSGQTLRSAIRSGDLNLIEELVRETPDLLKKKGENNPMIWALRSGRSGVATKLMKLGANLDDADQSKRSVLHWAIIRRNDEVLDAILSKSELLDRKDNNGFTPLFTALNYRHIDAAKKLLDAGCDVSNKTGQGMTALHLAFQTQNLEITERLIERGCDIFAQDNNGSTAFLFACQFASLDLVKKCFDEKRSLIKNRNGQSCLNFAIYSGDIEKVKFICEKTDLARASGSPGNDPVFSACQMNYPKIVELLLKNGASPNTLAANSNAQAIPSPLELAVSYMSPELTQTLLKAGANVDVIQNQTGDNPLHIICRASGQNFGGQASQNTRATKVLSLLLDAKTDPNVKNKAGQLPLDVAIQFEFTPGIDLLINRTREVKLELGDQSFLHWACQRKMTNTVDFLLKKDKSKLNESNSDGQTPLCIASLRGDLATMKSLLNSGADVNLIGEDGLAPIHAALAEIPTQPNETRVQVGGFGRPANLGGGQKQKQVATRKSPKVLELLIDSGADVTLADSSGRMPLHIAAWHGNTNAIKLFAERSVDMTPLTQAGSSPLHLAAWQDHVEAAKLLIAFNVPIDGQDQDGWTPLHKAAHRGNLPTVKLLLENGADKTMKDSLGLAAFQKAGGEKREAIEKLLRF